MWKNRKKKILNYFPQIYPPTFLFKINYFPTYTQNLWKIHPHNISQVDLLFTIMWKNKKKITILRKFYVEKYVDNNQGLGNNPKF